MERSEERFFEDLAHYNGREASQPQPQPRPAMPQQHSPYEVELARTSTSPTRKIAVAREEEEEPPAVYDDDSPEGQLTIDVYQTPNDIIVESAIAGVRPEDIDINVSNDSITIRGERKRESRIREEDYFYQECYWGRFSRSVILPQEVDPDSASVAFKNGILTVRMPKLNRKKQRKLRVRME